MYHAMMIKLQFEEARVGRSTSHDPSPGDGKEVLPPLNDNFSTFYQTSIQPPSVQELYRQLRREGHRPSGSLLAFLIQHARNPGQARRFMEDAGISRVAISALSGHIDPFIDTLKKIPPDIYTSYIILLCRLAPRAVLVSASQEPCNEIEGKSTKQHWVVMQPRPSSASRRRQIKKVNVFKHITDLLQGTC
jgi:hypothetical protein